MEDQLCLHMTVLRCIYLSFWISYFHHWIGNYHYLYITHYKSLMILNFQLTQITSLFCLPWMFAVYILLFCMSKHFLNKRNNKPISMSTLLQLIELVNLCFLMLGTYSCKCRCCNTCKFIINCSTINIKGPKGSINVTETSICISKNVVYGIICKQCNIIYIGETDRRLAEWITEQICSI